MHDLRPTWWRRRRRAPDLSAFADDELPDETAERVSLQLALDPGVRQQLGELCAVDRLVEAALAPPEPLPDPATAAATIAAAAHTRGSGSAAPVATSRWTPLAVASVGLLVTAGIAFAGYRRGGLARIRRRA